MLKMNHRLLYSALTAVLTFGSAISAYAEMVDYYCDHCKRYYQENIGIGEALNTLTERLGDAAANPLGVVKHYCGRNADCRAAKAKYDAERKKIRDAHDAQVQQERKREKKVLAQLTNLKKQIADFILSARQSNMPADQQYKHIYNWAQEFSKNASILGTKKQTEKIKELIFFIEEKIATTGSIELVQYYWPKPLSLQEYKAYKNLNWQKFQRHPFAFGRDLGSGKPLFYYDIAGDYEVSIKISAKQTLNYIANKNYACEILHKTLMADRADVLGYLLDQCEGDGTFFIHYEKQLYDKRATQVVSIMANDLKRQREQLGNISDSDKRAALKKEIAEEETLYHAYKDYPYSKCPHAFAVLLSRIPQYELDDLRVFKKLIKEPGETYQLIRPQSEFWCKEWEKLAPQYTVNAHIVSLANTKMQTWKAGVVSPFNPVYISGNEKNEWIWRPGVQSPFMPGYVAGKEEHSYVWTPGLIHPTISGLTAGKKQDSWVIALGYIKDASGNIIWGIGKNHPSIKGLIASEKPGAWSIAPGYKKTGNNTYAWEAGKADTQQIGRYTTKKEGKWELFSGFGYDKSGKVVWVPGTKHPSKSNVVAGKERFQWIPAAGYRWSNPANAELNVVKK